MPPPFTQNSLPIQLDLPEEHRSLYRERGVDHRVLHGDHLHLLGDPLPDPHHNHRLQLDEEVHARELRHYLFK